MMEPYLLAAVLGPAAEALLFPDLAFRVDFFLFTVEYKLVVVVCSVPLLSAQ